MVTYRLLFLMCLHQELNELLDCNFLFLEWFHLCAVNILLMVHIVLIIFGFLPFVILFLNH